LQYEFEDLRRSISRLMKSITLPYSTKRRVSATRKIAEETARAGALVR
jgi:hypothetical protein